MRKRTIVIGGLIGVGIIAGAGQATTGGSDTSAADAAPAATASPSASPTPTRHGGIKVTVLGWSREDDHHVATLVDFTNHGTSPATEACTFVAFDGGGSDVGMDTDGPADDIRPGKTALVRLLIKTDVQTYAVAAVRQVGDCTSW